MLYDDTVSEKKYYAPTDEVAGFKVRPGNFWKMVQHV